MNSTLRYSLSLGLLVTLIVILMHLLGWFAWLERLTLDLRFRSARWRPEPMSDQIRHVDIDDGAMDSIGRWPWPRNTLSLAIDEINRAGARTIALDLLFSDPDETPSVTTLSAAPSSQPDQLHDDLPTPNDSALAASLACTNAVLPVTLSDAEPFDSSWSTPQGKKEFDALIALLQSDIRVDDFLASQKAGLTHPRIAFFRARPLEYERYAAWLAARASADDPSAPNAYQSFLNSLLGEQDSHIGDFPQRKKILQAFNQHYSWWLLAQRNFIQSDQSSTGTFADQAPLPVLAAAAHSVGFANATLDPDAGVRRTPLLRRAPGGSVLQLGLAAAAQYLGLKPADINVTSSALAINGQTFPLQNSNLVLYWPTSDFNWLGALHQSSDDSPSAGHLSIGAIVSLAQQRQRLARLESELQSVTHEIALGIFGDNTPSQLSEVQLKDLNDEITFRLKDVADAQSSGIQLTSEELDAVAPFQHYQLLNQSVTEGRAALASASDRLHESLNDKLVFIGFASTGAIVDKVHTPLDPQTPGVIVHATVADMVLSNRHLNHVPFWLTPFIILALGVIFSRIAARYSAIASAILAAAILAAYLFFAGIWSFQMFRLDLPIAAPAVASTGAWTACTALMAALNQRERSRITRQFKARVSPHLVDYLVGNPASLSVSGIQREITVLFLDIAGFTSLSEKLDGEATVTVLNRCMNALTAPITAQHGYVNKFLGDGLMAFWSAFHDDPQQSVFACRTALLCQQAIADLNASESMKNLPKLAVRIGIATDRVIVGDCGAPPLLNDYTVIGNGVNLASRLESANKAFGSSVLVDGNTYNAAKDAGFLTRPLGKIIVVGQSVPVSIFELLPPSTDPNLIALTTEAVAAFNALDFNAASAAFLKLSNTFGPSKLTQVYLSALSDHESLATGVLRLREK